MSFFFSVVSRTNVLSLFGITNRRSSWDWKTTLAQGDLEVVAGRRAGWAVLSTNRVFAAGTRTTTLFGGITDQLWGGKVDAQTLQKP